MVLAIAWTMLLFLLCLIPGEDLPEVDVPFIDKWTHFVLFAPFSFLWLMVFPGKSWKRLTTIFLISVVIGWLVEELQGLLTMLGRSKDEMDILADAIGGLLGVLLFRWFFTSWQKHSLS